MAIHAMYFIFLALARDNDPLSCCYNNAVITARNLIGAKKYNTKSYGGGIVFQSYNIDTDLAILNEYIQKELTE